MPMPDAHPDCVVVGGGPAGLTAAHYLLRFRRSVACFDDGDSRALRIATTRNFPAFPGGIAGAELLRRLRQQVSEAGGRILPHRVTRIEKADGGFLVHREAHVTRTRSVLLATGTRDVEPAVQGIEAVRERDLVRQCPICDGFEFSGKRILVIGKGAHGAREANFLRTFSSHVRLCEMPDIERVQVRSGAIAASLGNGTTVVCDVVYAALGSHPKSDLASELGAVVDDQGSIVVGPHCDTSVPGLFAAGDVVAALDQLAVATGHGAIAATAMHNFLRESEADRGDGEE